MTQSKKEQGEIHQGDFSGVWNKEYRVQIDRRVSAGSDIGTGRESSKQGTYVKESTSVGTTSF